MKLIEMFSDKGVTVRIECEGIRERECGEEIHLAQDLDTPVAYCHGCQQAFARDGSVAWMDNPRAWSNNPSRCNYAYKPEKVL